MSAPAERVWTVDTKLFDVESQQWLDVPNALVNALLEVNGLMLRIGGVLQIASRRHEIAQGRIETIALIFRWRSFVPVDHSQVAPPLEQDGTEAQAAAAPLPPVPELPEPSAEVPSPESVAAEMNDHEEAPVS